MKVLKKSSETSWGKKLHCKGYGTGTDGGCGALLLVAPRDVHSYVSHDYGGGSDTVYYYTCPECRAKTYISYGAWLKKSEEGP